MGSWDIAISRVQARRASDDWLRDFEGGFREDFPEFNSMLDCSSLLSERKPERRKEKVNKKPVFKIGSGITL